MSKPIAPRQARTALRRGILVKDGSHFRFYRPEARLFSGETVKHAIELTPIKHIDAITAERRDD